MKKILAFMVLSAVCLWMAAAIPQPAAYFSFDQADGSVRDSVSGGAFALPSSVAIRSGGPAGSFLNLQRMDSSFVSLGKGYGFSGDFSIAFWMRTAAGYKDTGAIILGRHMAGWTNGYWFMINAEWGYGAPNKLTFYYSNATVVSKTSLNDGRWHYVGLSLKKGEGASLFIDGVLEAKGPPVAMVVPDAEFVLGGLNWGSPHGSFAGDIDELGIFDRALEAADMKAMAANAGWFRVQGTNPGVPELPGMPGVPGTTNPSGVSMKITLKNGQVITLPAADIAKIEFGN